MEKAANLRPPPPPFRPDPSGMPRAWSAAFRRVREAALPVAGLIFSLLLPGCAVSPALSDAERFSATGYWRLPAALEWAGNAFGEIPVWVHRDFEQRGMQITAVEQRPEGLFFYISSPADAAGALQLGVFDADDRLLQRTVQPVRLRRLRPAWCGIQGGALPDRAALIRLDFTDNL